MDIRILNVKDAEKLMKIRLEALKNSPEAFSSSYEEDKQLSLETFKGRLEDHHAFTFGAFVNEQLIGIVGLILEKKNKIRHRANIVSMYVSPEYRKTGFGKSLMLAAIKHAKEIKGIEQIYLSVTATNGPAKRLYQGLGFETYGIDKKALKIEDTYFDEELMVLYF